MRCSAGHWTRAFALFWSNFSERRDLRLANVRYSTLMPEVTYRELLRRQTIRAVSDSGATRHAARPRLDASLAAETVRTKRAAAAVCAIVTKQQGSAHQTAWGPSYHVSNNLVLQPRVQGAAGVGIRARSGRHRAEYHREQ